jgi:hypothetical protein
MIILYKKFQSTRLTHDHGLLWSKMLLNLEFLQMKKENFIDKYLTTYQIIIKTKIHTSQIHQHKRTC